MSHLQEWRRLLKRGSSCSFSNYCPFYNCDYRKFFDFRILKITELKWGMNRGTLDTFGMHKWVPESTQSTACCLGDPICCLCPGWHAHPSSHVGGALWRTIVICPHPGNSSTLQFTRFEKLHLWPNLLVLHYSDIRNNLLFAFSSFAKRSIISWTH